MGPALTQVIGLTPRQGSYQPCAYLVSCRGRAPGAFGFTITRSRRGDGDTRERWPLRLPGYSNRTWWVKAAPSDTVICSKPIIFRRSKKVSVSSMPSSLNMGVSRALAVSVAR